MLRVPCATRWNSKFDAVSKVLDLGFEKINLYIDTLLKNMKSAAHLSKLEKDDWVMMNLYVKVMKPIAISLDRLQAEKDSSQGFILPTLLTMKHHLLQLEGGIVLRSMRDVMLNAIDKRFGAYFQIGNSNKELVLASVSNPRFKLNFIESEIDCLVAKDLLISECKNLSIDSNVSELEITNESNSNDLGGDFFVTFRRTETRRRSFDIVIEDEINRFLECDSTNYKMLNGFPNIRNVYFKHNTTLSASAAVERVFNQSNMIFTPCRNRLSAEIFEKLLLHKHNRRALNN